MLKTQGFCLKVEGLKNNKKRLKKLLTWGQVFLYSLLFSPLILHTINVRYIEREYKKLMFLKIDWDIRNRERINYFFERIIWDLGKLKKQNPVILYIIGNLR